MRLSYACRIDFKAPVRVVERGSGIGGGKKERGLSPSVVQVGGDVLGVTLNGGSTTTLQKR